MQQTIEIYQTSNSNRSLLGMLEQDSAFDVAVYDIWMSECIRVNRKAIYEQEDWHKKKQPAVWNKTTLKDGFDVRQLVHTVYPKGSVSKLNQARVMFKRKFLETTKKLSTYVYELNTGAEVPYVFVDEPELRDNRLYPEFSHTMIYNTKVDKIPSPLYLPVELYRPLRGKGSPLSFIMNRKLFVHWRMNEKSNPTTMLISLRSIKAMMQLESEENWCAHKERTWKDGFKMWTDRKLKQPIEAYGLFRFDGFGYDDEYGRMVRITRLW